MTGVADSATGKTLELLSAPVGINAQLAAIASGTGALLAEVGAKQMMAQNVAIELAERSSEVQYPAVHVYCERLSNSQREKFRTFSGKAQMAVEVRYSQDRLEGIEGRVRGYADAVARVLEGSLGDWGDGMFYGGGYDVAFGAVKRGGRNFVQVARVTFEVEVSRS
ncbi:MAG TPA: hypothetical protein VN442_17715 [Bryobacteraceae bacterium]|nr:hypothetical protein [Bryobacteraceae bacterium]